MQRDPTARHYTGVLCLNWKSPLGPSTGDVEKGKGVRGDGGYHKNTQPTELPKQGSETAEIVREPVWVSATVLCICYGCLAWCFCGTPYSGS